MACVSRDSTEREGQLVPREDNGTRKYHEMHGVFMFLFRQPQDIVECLKQRSGMMTLKLSRANFEYCSEHELVVWKGQRMNYANLLGGLVIGNLVRSDWIVNIVGMNKQWGLLMNSLSVFYVMCIRVWLHVCLCIMCVPGALRCRRVLDSGTWSCLQVVVSHHVGDGYQICVLLKSSQCS